MPCSISTDLVLDAISFTEIVSAPTVTVSGNVTVKPVILSRTASMSYANVYIVSDIAETYMPVASASISRYF